MKVKVIIVDGVVDTVLMDQEALDANIDVVVVDYDKNNGTDELLDAEYEESGLKNGSFNVEHCIADDNT